MSRLIILLFLSTVMLSCKSAPSPDAAKGGVPEKAFKSSWSYPATGFVLDLRAAAVPGTVAHTATIQAGGCQCALEITGDGRNGTIKLHGCGFVPNGCQNVYINGTYVAGGNVLRICDPIVPGAGVGTCYDYQ